MQTAPTVTDSQPIYHDFDDGITPNPTDACEYDVVIVGGGIVGNVAACALGQAGMKVAIVEAEAQSMASDRGQAYSINLLSVQVFEDLGLWQRIRPQVETYRSVQLSDGDYRKVVQFSPQDLGRETIGYVAEHRILLEALQYGLKALPNVDCICPATVTETVKKGDRTIVRLAQTSTQAQILSAKLVIAADGSRSPLRQAANITTLGWQYWQSCIVAFIQPEHPHKQTAYERFQPDGPFAILPLPNGLCRIVWTAPRAVADRMLTLNPDDFMTELRSRYGNHMGKLTLVGQPSVFPVRLLHSTQYVKPGLALIGDAAHCCHPVGGQGINLGIRDAAALVNVIENALTQDKDFATLSVLKQYERWRMGENLVVLGLTDTLTRVFSNKIWPIVLIRRVSLWILQDIPPIRSLVLRHMQGLTGKAPRIVGQNPKV
jgi:2-octaprenyl-6-methoxyphenol hydroxylase